MNKFYVFWTPTTEWDYVTNDLVVKDKDGWSNTWTLNIKVINEDLPAFYIPDQIWIQWELFELELSHYVVSNSWPVLSYSLLTDLTSYWLSIDNNTWKVSWNITQIWNLTVVVSAENAEWIWTWTFSLELVKNTWLCEDEVSQDTYEIESWYWKVIKAKVSSEARCVYVDNTSSKNIVVFNKKAWDFENFENSVWSSNLANVNISDVTYSYWGWSYTESGPKVEVLIRNYTRKCYRNWTTQVDCKYCWWMCTKTSTAVFQRQWGSWRLWSHPWRLFYRIYKIEWVNYSWSWWNCNCYSSYTQWWYFKRSYVPFTSWAHATRWPYFTVPIY